MKQTSPNTRRLGAALLAVYLSAAPARLLAQEAAPEAAAPATPAAAPPAAPPPPVQDLPVVEVVEPRLELTLRAPFDVALFTMRQVEGATGERQCGGDCTVSLAPGRYRFALAERKRGPVAVPGTFRLEGSDVLEARYESARNKRIAGSLLLALVFPASASGLVASLKAFAALDELCDPTGHCVNEEASGALRANIAISSITMVASGVLGSWLVSRRDRAELRLRGLSAGNRREREGRPAEPKAPAEEPIAQAEPLPELPVAPADVHADDLAKITAQRADLAQCFGIWSAKPVLLDIAIDAKGRAVRVEPSRALSERVHGCLRRTLGRIVFLEAEARTVRMLLTP